MRTRGVREVEDLVVREVEGEEEGSVPSGEEG